MNTLTNSAVTDMPGRFVSRLTRDTLALVLAGGRGTRLDHLTDWRAKPAVPFGGKFRIIDFPLSNCVNSGIRQIAVVTQYKAHSLIRHIQRGWGFMRGNFGEFVEIFPASQRTPSSSWYAGTADAVYQNLDILRSHAPEYVLILAGDHIYKMDYGLMLAHHLETGADMTVGCIEVPVAEASAFGVMTVDDTLRVVDFDEKPASPTSLPNDPDRALVSMGIYVFNTKFLYEQLIIDADTKGSTHDFGKDVIPSIIQNYRISAYPFRDQETGQQAYWRDVGTVDAFWEANMELIDVTPELNLYDERWPIWTLQEQLPPAKFVFDDEERRGMAVDSMVSGGCIVAGGYIKRSVLFSSVRVESHARCDDSVLLPNVRVGEGAQIAHAIIDKGCIIPPGMSIGVDRSADERRFSVSPNGVVLVTPEMLGQELHYAR
ncbi:MAG: glucose-1-phosphate adenylyltransferase [Pseudomonadota bacterium]